MCTIQLALLYTISIVEQACLFYQIRSFIVVNFTLIKIYSIADLLAMCAYQLQCRNKDLKKTTLYLQHIQLEG